MSFTYLEHETSKRVMAMKNNEHLRIYFLLMICHFVCLSAVPSVLFLITGNGNYSKEFSSLFIW